MTETQNIPWKRIAVEASAIVASILFAFGIDAWWQERLERLDEQELLNRLSVEFSANLDRIDQRQNYGQIIERNAELFRLVDGALSEGKEAVESPSFVLRIVLAAPTFEADTPILDALTKAGKLEIIEDLRIAAALSVWERLLRDYTGMAERARQNVDNLLLPELYKRGDIGPILMRPRPGLLPPNNSLWSDSVTIRIDDEIKGLIAGRYVNGSSAQNKFGELREAAAEVIAAIDASHN